MSEILILWCGAKWSIEGLEHGEYRCVVVDAPATSGWHVGEHCWLTPTEVQGGMLDHIVHEETP